MTIKELISNFLSFFARSPRKQAMPLLEETTKMETSAEKEEEKINIARRTLMTKLYFLEQEITVFENEYPDRYNEFKNQIEGLRETYNSSLEEIKRKLTFEVDPEIDSCRINEVVMLERDIKNFIEKDVKFSILSKSLQRLILKLNILYNTSIWHCKESEKANVISQVERAFETEKRLANDFKENDYILMDRQLKERIINLISYIDYQIFKTYIRNSNKKPCELLKLMVTLVEFEEFQYQNVFKAYIEDELSNLGELLKLIPANVDEYAKILEKELRKIATNVAIMDISILILDDAFWSNIIDIESNILELLKSFGVEKEKTKIKVISKMDIRVDENEVIVSPKTNTYLTFTTIYSKTRDEKIFVLRKLLTSLSSEITYKEIYFLLLLFDSIDILRTVPNNLIRYLEKYLSKYPYNGNTIRNKKEQVIASSNKEYLVAFVVSSDKNKIIKTLDNLNIDYRVDNDKILVNSFYFNGLNNVLCSLQTNTYNI